MEGFVVGEIVGFVVEGFVVVGKRECFMAGLNMVGNDRSQKEICHNILDVLEGKCNFFIQGKTHCT